MNAYAFNSDQEHNEHSATLRLSCQAALATAFDGRQRQQYANQLLRLIASCAAPIAVKEKGADGRDADRRTRTLTKRPSSSSSTTHHDASPQIASH
jgi:hypothetical protein